MFSRADDFDSGATDSHKGDVHRTNVVIVVSGLGMHSESGSDIICGVLDR